MDEDNKEIKPPDSVFLSEENSERPLRYSNPKRKSEKVFTKMDEDNAEIKPPDSVFLSEETIERPLRYSKPKRKLEKAFSEMPTKDQVVPQFMSSKNRKNKKQRVSKGAAKIIPLKQKPSKKKKKKSKHFIQQLTKILGAKLKKDKEPYITSAGNFEKKNTKGKEDKKKEDKKDNKKASAGNKGTRLHINTKGDKNFKKIVDTIKNADMGHRDGEDGGNFDLSVEVQSTPDGPGSGHNVFTKNVKKTQTGDGQGETESFEESSSFESSSSSSHSSTNDEVKFDDEKNDNMKMDMDMDNMGFDDFEIFKKRPSMMSDTGITKRKRKKAPKKIVIIKRPGKKRVQGGKTFEVPNWIKAIAEQANMFLQNDVEKFSQKPKKTRSQGKLQNLINSLQNRQKIKKFKPKPKALTSLEEFRKLFQQEDDESEEPEEMLEDLSPEKMQDEFQGESLPAESNNEENDFLLDPNAIFDDILKGFRSGYNKRQGNPTVRLMRRNERF